MSQQKLEPLLGKLCKGDAAAAEEVFRTYEPYLRLVVRRLLPSRLRSKFDSADVVQSVWGDVLDGFRVAGWQFQSPAQLKAFLVKVTRNRFIDRVRRYRNASRLERPLDPSQPEPLKVAATRPSQVAQAHDLWHRLLALCPPAHRELLHLKRQGYSLDEIAGRTGLHKSSVRRILYDLARRLALERPAGVEV